MNNSIVLTSGGLDSIVLAYYLKKIKKIKKVILLFVNYGQKSLNEELFCVRKAAEKLKLRLKIIDAGWLGEISTSLINKEANEDEIKKMRPNREVISWYVPCRNSLFLLMGLALAESYFISDKEKYNIYLGIKYEGELRFKDTTPEFIREMNKMVSYSTEKGKYEFIAPFLKKDKEELIHLAKKLKVSLEYTYSCYTGKGFREINKDKIPIHCGICSGCKARKKAFRFSNAADPSIYLENS